MAKMNASDGSLPAFTFRVVLGDLSIGFSEISGLKQETEEILYRNGDEATRQHKLRGLTTFQDVTLKQGLLRDGVAIQEALTTFNIESGTAQASQYVYGEVRIVQMDQSGADVLEWTLENAWVSSVEIDSYDSNSSALQFSTLTLKHEGLRYAKKS